jgi:hypothetical protein
MGNNRKEGNRQPLRDVPVKDLEGQDEKMNNSVIL